MAAPTAEPIGDRAGLLALQTPWRRAGVTGVSTGPAAPAPERPAGGGPRLAGLAESIEASHQLLAESGAAILAGSRRLVAALCAGRKALGFGRRARAAETQPLAGETG
jgi:hypothetical protein